MPGELPLQPDKLVVEGTLDLFELQKKTLLHELEGFKSELWKLPPGDPASERTLFRLELFVQRVNQLSLLSLGQRSILPLP